MRPRHTPSPRLPRPRGKSELRAVGRKPGTCWPWLTLLHPVLVLSCPALLRARWVSCCFANISGVLPAQGLRACSPCLGNSLTLLRRRSGLSSHLTQPGFERRFERPPTVPTWSGAPATTALLHPVLAFTPALLRQHKAVLGPSYKHSLHSVIDHFKSHNINNTDLEFNLNEHPPSRLQLDSLFWLFAYYFLGRRQQLHVSKVLCLPLAALGPRHKMAPAPPSLLLRGVWPTSRTPGPARLWECSRPCCLLSVTSSISTHPARLCVTLKISQGSQPTPLCPSTSGDIYQAFWGFPLMPYSLELR